VAGVPRPQGEDEALPPAGGLEQVDVHAASPILPVVALVMRLRTELQMLRVHTEPVMAAVPDDVVLARDLAVQNAVEEAVGRDLTPSELDLSRRGRRGRD
jgi:hypothetical protein